MNVLDGFWFWIGKQLAEVALTASIVVLVLLVYIVIALYQERQDRKRAALEGK